MLYQPSLTRHEALLDDVVARKIAARKFVADKQSFGIASDRIPIAGAQRAEEREECGRNRR